MTSFNRDRAIVIGDTNDTPEHLANLGGVIRQFKLVDQVRTYSSPELTDACTLRIPEVGGAWLIAHGTGALAIGKVCPDVLTVFTQSSGEDLVSPPAGRSSICNLFRGRISRTVADGADDRMTPSRIMVQLVRAISNQDVSRAELVLPDSDPLLQDDKSVITATKLGVTIVGLRALNRASLTGDPETVLQDYITRTR